MTPDVNVLVAAFRADHPHHADARKWLGLARAACAAGQDSLAVLPMVLAGFLHLVTNPKVFVQRPGGSHDGLNHRRSDGLLVGLMGLSQCWTIVLKGARGDDRPARRPVQAS